MTAFNRLMVAILCLALAGVAISILVLAWTIPDESIDGLRDAVRWLNDHNEDGDKAVLTFFAVVIAALALIVANLEILPRRGRTVNVEDIQVGDATLSAAAVAQRVEEAVQQAKDVLDARATVRSRRNGVEVLLDLHVASDSNLAAVTDAAVDAARDVLSNRLHVAIARAPRVRLQYRGLGRRDRPSPAAPPAPEPGDETKEEPAASEEPEEPQPDAEPETGPEQAESDTDRPRSGRSRRPNRKSDDA